MRIDGAFRSVRTIAFAIRNQADEISRVAGITQDVTVAKRAEQALRQSRDLYRDLVENSGVLMGTHDEEGRIVSVNQAAVELAGLQTAEQMVGRKISDFLTLETRDLFSSYLETVLQQGRAQGLMRVRTGTGQERILEYKNSLRREGLDRPIVRCIGHDVTDQKQAEGALNESEARYRLVAENSQDLIALIEPAGKILYASPSHFPVLGYSPDSLIHNSMLRFVHSEDAGRLCRLAQDLVRSGGAATIELRLKKVNADWLQFEAIASAIADANGAVSRLLVSARNITERRRAEESLHRVSGRLIQLQDEERRHIARELHDSTAQSLAALAMNLQSANDSAVEFSPHVRNVLSESASLVSHCLREIRTLSYLLHPPQPDDFGFASALRCYAAGFARRRNRGEAGYAL
jgi:PAS domain S-box-containing protein